VFTIGLSLARFWRVFGISGWGFETPLGKPLPTITPPASQNTTVVVPPSDFSPVPDTFGRKQEQATKHEHSRKGSTAFLMSLP